MSPDEVALHPTLFALATPAAAKIATTVQNVDTMIATQLNNSSPTTRHLDQRKSRTGYEEGLSIKRLIALAGLRVCSCGVAAGQIIPLARPRIIPMSRGRLPQLVSHDGPNLASSIRETDTISGTPR